jgi:periplasmic divalent cation tolerance protein
MLDPADFVVVLVTVPDVEIGARLGRALVEEQLAACVNLVPGLRSIYAWKGAVHDDAEVLCVLKSRRALFAPLRDRVLSLHPYEVPEVIALPLAEGSPAYLAWLAQGTATPSVSG